LYVPDLVGYTFEAPAGEPYDVVWRDDDAASVPLNRHDSGGRLRINPAWADADVRISFARAKTDDGWGYALSIANLLGLVSYECDAIHWPASDRALHLSRTTAPHFAIIDAAPGAHGQSGARDGRAMATDTFIASPNALLADWIAALKMGIDPEISPLNRVCLKEIGLPAEWDLIGDTTPWKEWTNPSPGVLGAVRNRARWPELDALARAILQP